MKATTMAKRLAVPVLAMGAASLSYMASATDAVWQLGSASSWNNSWTDYNLSRATWNTASYWVDSYVAGADDSAYFTNSVAMYNGRPIYFQYIATPTVDVALEKVVGDSNRVFVASTDGKVLTIGDANGFDGAYRSYMRKAGFAFGSSTDVATFYADGYPYLGVVNAGDTVTVKKFGGRGTVFKTGDGTLRIEDGSPDSRVRIASGTLALGGHDYPDAPVEGYSLRLDASDTNAMTFVEGADGRRYVSQWNGTGSSANPYAYSDDAATHPYLRENWLNGMPAVDFGAVYSTQQYMTGDERYGELGHAAYMKFKSTQTSRSVFYVQEETQYTNCMPVIMGHNTGACFYRVSHYNGNPITPTASGLLYGHYLAEQFVAGDFRMNSVNVPFNHGEPGGFARPIVYSAATVANADTVSFNRLMRDRDIKWGGARVGELMMYDSRLTTEQIRQNNAYLSKKWLGGMEEAVDCDVGTVYFPANVDAKVSVENGKTAQVPKLLSGTAGKPVLVKDGGGTLALDEIYPAKTAIKVKAGKIAFRDMVSRKQPPDDAPAPEPMFWVKADDAAHITTENGKVTRWDDCRGASDKYYAYWDSSRTYAKPDLVADALAGKPIVDFGPYQSNKNGAAMMIYGNPAPVEAFIVWQSSDERNVAWVFASDNYDFTRSTTTDSRIISPDSASPGVLGAQWYVDGRAVDPENVSLGTEAHVINYAAHTGFTYNRIATDRTTSMSRSGGMKVAEIVLYNRILSGEERRRTQAYLLKRWKNANHPCTERKHMREVAFDDGVQPEIEVNSDIVVDGIRGSGTLRLAGSGSLTLNSPLPDTITGVDAGKARFSTVLDPAEIIRTKAILDLDASRTDSMEFDTVDQTRIVEWRDANGGAYAAYNAALATNMPQLVDVTINGAPKKSVCLFDMCVTGKGTSYTNYQAPTNLATGFDIRAVSGSWNGDGAFNAQEFFVVMADYNSQNQSWTHRANIVDSKVTASSAYFRNNKNSGGIVRKDGYETAIAKQSSYMFDGADHVDYGTKVTDFDYHVYTFTQTNNTDVSVSSYGWGATGGTEWIWGGRCVCEVIYFQMPLTDGERRLVHDYLRQKWQSAAIASDMTCDDVRLDGGAVSFGADRLVTVSEVSGGGTIAAKSVTLAENGRLDFSFTGNGSVSEVTVDGAFVLPAAFTLSLSAVMAEKPAVGEYRLLSATSLSGNLDGMTLESDLPRSRHARLYVSGNSIVLKVYPDGMVIICR